MLDKALRRLRAATVDPWQLLGSWRLSVALMVSAAVWYVLLAFFSAFSPPHVIQSIAVLGMFWALWALIFLSTAVCLWRRAGALRRDLVELRRWSSLGSYVFHLALFLVAAGFLATIESRQETKIRIAEGEDYGGGEEQTIESAAPRPLALRAPDIRFRLERIDAKLWGDQLLFTDLAASLVLPDGGRATTRINRPLVLGPATFLRLTGLGYAPRYEILDARGMVIESAFVKMRVFPPGQRDFVLMTRLPFRIYLEVYPDATIEEGQVRTRSLNLANPVFVAKVYRGKLLVASGQLRRGEELLVEGLRLRFPEIRYWGDFSIMRDVGAPLIFAGFLLGLGGLTLRLTGGES